MNEKHFLVVVDESNEVHIALRYAARRAKSINGRVALLYVIEQENMQYWAGLDDLMRQEHREEAEEILKTYSAAAGELSGNMPLIYIREGNRQDEVLKIIKEEKDITFLVLAGASGSNDPGPLVTAFSGKLLSSLRVPVIIVPGELDPEHIDEIT